MSDTIATLSGDPSGDAGGAIVETADGYEVLDEDDETIGTMTEGDFESLKETVEAFVAGEETDVPDFEGTAALGQVEHPLLMLAGHSGLAISNEDEDAIALFEPEDIIGA